MIHRELLTKIYKDRRHRHFQYPYYNGYSIADIVPTIWRFFGLASDKPGLKIKELESVVKPKKIITFILDGFGFNHFSLYGERFPLYQKLIERGDVYPITSVFPSTTPAALTALHTGLQPQQHGLPEWTVYFEEFDSIIETLPFKHWGTPVADALIEDGGNGEMLYEGETAYSKLKAAGVNCINFVSQHYSHSVYSQSVQEGSEIIAFESGEDLMAKLAGVVNRDEQPAYIVVYWGYIDSAAHHFGPDSPEHIEAMGYFSDVFQEFFIPNLDQKQIDNCYLLMTADHGHVNIRREDIINLNKYPMIQEGFMKSAAGKRILPTGSPHDVFLFIEPEKRWDLYNFLKRELKGKAEVITTQEAFQRELFGTDMISPKFVRRIGDILILPYPGSHIWYEFLPDEPFSMLGIHGGLSEEEMIVPLGIVEIEKLLG